MKILLALLFVIPTFMIPTAGYGQNFINLKAGETQEINGIAVSYIAAKKKTKKGQDLYRVTVTITNHGSDYLQMFPIAMKVFMKNDRNALAYFQFVNATGRGMSATTGKIHAKPLTIQVPIDCLKCPVPKDPKADKYKHTIKTYVIGTRFLSGSTFSRVFNIRVAEGSIPSVRAMLK